MVHEQEYNAVHDMEYDDEIEEGFSADASKSEAGGHTGVPEV